MPLDNNLNTTTYIKTAYGRFLIADPHGDYEVKNKETGEVRKYRSFINLRQFLLLSIDMKAPNLEKKLPAQWMINFVDQVEGQKYTLALKIDSYVALGLINSLAAVEDFTRPLTLSAYMKKDRTYVSLAYSNEAVGSYIRWKYEPKDIPETKALTRPDGTPFLDANGYAVYDTKEKMEFFKGVVDKINQVCTTVSSHNLVPRAFPQVDPESVVEVEDYGVDMGSVHAMLGKDVTGKPGHTDHRSSFDDAELPF